MDNFGHSRKVTKVMVFQKLLPHNMAHIRRGEGIDLYKLAEMHEWLRDYAMPQPSHDYHF